MIVGFMIKCFYLKQNQMFLVILPLDMSGVTRMHDQINKYWKSKSKLYSEINNLNRESLMAILADMEYMGNT